MARPKKSPNELMANLNLKVEPELLADVESIGNVFDRKKSYIGRKLLLRGLAAYRRDGMLDEPQHEPKPEIYDPAVHEPSADFTEDPVLEGAK